MIGTVLAILSLAASAAGMAGSAMSNARTSRNLKKREKELKDEYTYDYNMDVLNTPQAQSAISLLSKKYIEDSKKIAQGNVITGASDERAVASAAERQKPYIDVISQLAGMGSERANAIRRNYLYSNQHMGDLMYGNDMQKGTNWASFGTNALNAAGAFSQADAYGAFKGGNSSLKGLSKQTWKTDVGGLKGTTRLAPSLFAKR